MKSISLTVLVGLVALPIAGLLHLVLSLSLLHARVFSDIPYIVGDACIAAAFVACLVVAFVRDRRSASQGSEGRRPVFEKVLAACAIALCVALMWSVRIDYSGPIYDGTAIVDAEHEALAMPAFSDEWLYAGFAKKTAMRREVPLFDPFGSASADGSDRGGAQNMLAPYVAGFAGASISAGVDAVYGYWAYAFAFQLALSLAIYVFLRSFGLGRFAASAGLVLFAFLPESNLLPGPWIMLPAYVGLIFFLMGCSLAYSRTRHGKARLAGIYSNFILASIVYPPYLILAAAWMLIGADGTARKKKLAIILALGAGIAIALIIAALAGLDLRALSAEGVLRSAWHMMVRERVGAATEDVWSYVPIVFYLTSASGLWIALLTDSLGIAQKKTLLFGSGFLSLLLAATYLFDKEIILSHQRSVFLLWVLMIVMTCFFFEHARARFFGKPGWSEAACIAILDIALLSVLVSGSYPRIPEWRGVTADVDVLLGPVSSRPVMLAMLPIGFGDLIGDRKGRFIGDPYASLAIGATTGIMPVSASPSFMTIDGPLLSDFRRLDSCAERVGFASRHFLSHMIVRPQDADLLRCPEFSFGGKLGNLYLIYDRI